MKVQSDGKGMAKELNYDFDYASNFLELNDDRTSLPIFKDGKQFYEAGVFEVEVKDAVVKSKGDIEIYTAKPLHGINDLGWKEIEVFNIITPKLSGNAEQVEAENGAEWDSSVYGSRHDNEIASRHYRMGKKDAYAELNQQIATSKDVEMLAEKHATSELFGDIGSDDWNQCKASFIAGHTEASKTIAKLENELTICKTSRDFHKEATKALKENVVNILIKHGTDEISLNKAIELIEAL